MFNKGGVASVVQLLTSDLQDVLVNAVRCIRALCVACPQNQTTVAQCGAIPQLVDLLTVNSGTVVAIATIIIRSQYLYSNNS